MSDKKLLKEWKKFIVRESEASDAFVKASTSDVGIGTYVPLLKKIASDPDFQKIARAGKGDGDPNDEAFEVKEGSTKAANLQATQLEIGADNSLKDQMADNYKATQAALGLSGSPIQMPAPTPGRSAILTFAGKYILDGHHRWSQVMMMNPEGTVAIDDLQPNGVLRNPEAALKLMQLAIAVKAGKVVTKDFKGDNLMEASPEDIYKYALSNITDSVLQLMVKAGKIEEPNKELAARYIAGNLRIIKSKKGKFPRGAVMPQAGKAGASQSDVNAALGTGAINFDKPNPQDVKNVQEQKTKKRKNTMSKNKKWSSFKEQQRLTESFRKWADPLEEDYETRWLDQMDQDASYRKWKKHYDPKAERDQRERDRQSREDEKNWLAKQEREKEEARIPKIDEDEYNELIALELAWLQDPSKVYQPSKLSGYGARHEMDKFQRYNNIRLRHFSLEDENWDWAWGIDDKEAEAIEDERIADRDEMRGKEDAERKAKYAKSFKGRAKKLGKSISKGVSDFGSKIKDKFFEEHGEKFSGDRELVERLIDEALTKLEEDKE